MSNVLSEVMLAADMASYTVNGSVVAPLPAGYVLDTRFGLTHNGILVNTKTGFQAIALRNASTGEYIIAFTGTQDSQDWFQNLKLGFDQWDDTKTTTGDPKQVILTYLNGLTDVTQIHFTGHSLGGALAQYAAYDYIDQFKSNATNLAAAKSRIALTTFNALGGLQGLTQYRPDGFTSSLFSGIYNRHYWVEGDLVSRLGGGHLGGQAYFIDNILGPAPLDLIEGHMLATVDLLTPTGFLDDRRANPAYLQLGSVQPIASMMAGALNNSAEAGGTEATLRIFAGLLGGAALYSQSPDTYKGQLNQMVNAVLLNLAAAHPNTDEGRRYLSWAGTDFEAMTSNLVGGVLAGLGGQVAFFAAVLADVFETTTVKSRALVTDALNLLRSSIDFVFPGYTATAEAALNKLFIFLDTYASSSGDALAATQGRPNDPAVALTNLTLTEGGSGTLTLALSKVSDTNGQALILTVYDPDLIQLSGPGVTARSTLGEYLVIVPAGQMAHSITVTGLEDADRYQNFDFIRAELTPFSELGSQFQEAPYAIAEVTILDNDQPTPPSYGLSLIGDLAPIDQDAGANGVQLGYDALGNVIVGSEAAPGRHDGFADSTGNDLIRSLSGNDLIVASFGGDDRLEGGDGEDIIDAGPGDDIVTGNAGQDLIAGGTGADVLHGGDEHALDAALLAGETQAGNGQKGDLLGGGDGDDSLIGDAGNDVLGGGAGGDILLGGGGDDTLAGDEDLTNASHGWTLTRNANTDANGNTQFQRQYANVDVAENANGSADILYGGAGNDWLFGQKGEDVLDGGADDDVLFGGSGSDVLLGQGGNDNLLGDDDATPIDQHGDDYLDGGAGNDNLYGKAGNDQLMGGTGNDKLWGHRGDDDLKGGADQDWLMGDDAAIPGVEHGADILDGGDGDDYQFGQGGNDRLYGGIGNDHLQGDDGALAGEYHGDDTIYGGGGNDTLLGDGGNDTLEGGDGNDLLLGDNASNQPLSGEYHGNDTLDGGAGNDQLYGGGGNDELIGGADLDYLDGGAGDDVYHFVPGDSPIVNSVADSINDTSGFDRIEFGAGVNTGNILAYQFGQDMALQYGTADWIWINGGFNGNVESFGFADSTRMGWSQLIGLAFTSVVNTSTSTPNATLTGGNLSDNLTATGGGGTFSGGQGNDTLSGAGGNNTYLYNLGDGTDSINDRGAHVDGQGNPAPNVLMFGEGIASADLSLGLGSLLIRVGSNPNDAIRIANFDPGNVYAQRAIDLFKFADGSVLTYEQLLERGFDLTGTTTNDIITGTNIQDRIAGGAGDDILEGHAGDDILAGEDGNDMLFGGAGNDTLLGGTGNDTYYFNLGDGIDTLRELQGNNSTVVLKLGDGISPNDITLKRDGNHLELQHANGLDKVIVTDWFDVMGDSRLDCVEFASGTQWSAGDIAALLATQDGEFEGSAGDDLLIADGPRSVAFVVRAKGTSAAGIAPEMEVRLDGELINAVQVTSSGYTDFALSGYFTPSQIARLDVVFHNDAVINGEDRNLYIDSIRFGERVIRPTDVGVTYDRGSGVKAFDNNDTRAGQVGIYWNGALRFNLPADLAGIAVDDSMRGLDGNDTLSSGGGSDLLYGGNGNDLLLGGAGADTLDGEAGNDKVQGGGDADVLRGGDGDDDLLGDGPPAQNIVVRARGSMAAGVAPSMTVRLDGVDIGTMRIGDTNFANYTFSGEFQQGMKSMLDVVFNNDAVIAGEDRNLFVESVLVGDKTLTPASAATYDKGKGIAAFDGVNVIAGQTGMYWNGALRFELAADLFGAAGNDSLIGGAGNDSLNGGTGNDTYLFNRGDGVDAWTENDATLGNLDIARFGTDIAHDQIWFRKSGSDLEVSIIGAADKTLVKNWYAGSAYHIERFEAGNGKALLDSQIDALVAAMAAFAPPAAGQTTLPPNYQAALAPVIAPNWQ